MGAFFQTLQTKDATDVLYLSQQNDNLRREFPSLLENGMVAPFLELGVKCFGNQPDAINLWIGDEGM